MWRYYKIVLLVFLMWMRSVYGGAPLLTDLISTDIIFPEVIENIYANHMQCLFVAAQLYEQVIDKKTPIMQLHETLYEKRLEYLMHAVESKIKEICQPVEVQESFERACKNAQCNVKLKQRIEFWYDFINSLNEQHSKVHLTHLPEMWFACGPAASNEWNYMVNNTMLKLNKMQCSYVIALMVSTFLPLALMAHYDKEAFSAFLRAR